MIFGKSRGALISKNFDFLLKVKAPIRWPRPFYQKLTLRAAKIMGALTLKSRILNYFLGALALETREMQFYSSF